MSDNSVAGASAGARTPEPCPFCASQNGVTVYPNDHAEVGAQMGVPHLDVFYVRCDQCGADGPVCDSHNEAVQKWNRRAVAQCAALPLPTPITDAQCVSAMREFSAPKGESFDAMWSQCDEQTRGELLGEWRSVLECAEVSGCAALPTTTRLNQLANMVIDELSGPLHRSEFDALLTLAGDCLGTALPPSPNSTT
jgi:hypothetical protein